eukprot:TRINITY_DN5956_c0_g1_i1.p1 TRINITY_DN5956_c0_g1~~TRINITY_DN5956_c0_g1_i1.p1  ORF type:complete len:170 (-),score=12.74 TRINITY_DN5956_c0_g1_i1:80-589(-)
MQTLFFPGLHLRSRSVPFQTTLIKIQRCGISKDIKPHKVKTKNAARKRFQLTKRGDVKHHPSRLKGKVKIMNRRALVGPYQSLKRLLANSTRKSPGFKQQSTRAENRGKKLSRVLPHPSEEQILNMDLHCTHRNGRLHPRLAELAQTTLFTNVPRHPLVNSWHLGAARE